MCYKIFSVSADRYRQSYIKKANSIWLSNLLPIVHILLINYRILSPCRVLPLLFFSIAGGCRLLKSRFYSFSLHVTSIMQNLFLSYCLNLVESTRSLHLANPSSNFLKLNLIHKVRTLQGRGRLPTKSIRKCIMGKRRLKCT